MDSRLEKIKADFLNDTKNIQDLEVLKIKYLGRKSQFSQILRTLKDLPIERRKKIGEDANVLRGEISDSLNRFLFTSSRPVQKKIDVTLPGVPPEIGLMHPVTEVTTKVRAIFSNMGYATLEGPEVETDYYNFEALNIPKGHPARDMHDTFYIDQSLFPASLKHQTYLLRTHISTMQVRVMEKYQPPFAVISPGRVFRREATDARHEHTWDYIEVFAVGENISLANLKYTLTRLLKEFFGETVKTRFRPSFFPFVEPGLEVIMSCVFCNGKGCRICTSGWIEMLGAGMIHPNILAAAGYPVNKYRGFAFGGLSRFVMMKYDIPDIRLLYKNDLRYWRHI